MKPAISVKQMRDNSAAIKQAFKALQTQHVLVGIPEDKSARKAEDGAPIGNAALGYIAEHGSPANNIPARPLLRPGIKSILPDARELLRDAARQAAHGNAGAVMTNFNKIGLLAVNAVRAMFVANDWAPLSSKTLEARSRKENMGQRRKKGQALPPPRRSNPLIVTGQLRKAITYVVRGRGK
jgi:hypothetical protein